MKKVDTESRILLVVKNPVGGIKTYFRYVYSDEELFNNRFDVVSIGNDTDQFTSTFGKRLKRVYTSFSNIGVIVNVIRSIFSSKPKIIHSHGLTAGVLTFPMALIFRVKHIVTLHGIFSEHDFNGFKGKLTRLVLKVFFKHVTLINPCGYDAEKNLISYFPSIDKSKIKVIRNGIDVDSFDINTQRDLREELNLDTNVFLIGFLGRFMEEKGFDLLIQAIDQAKDTKIHVACFGWGGYIREEQEKIEGLGLSKQFHFLPHTDQVAHSLRGLDLLIIPSRSEACPLLPMEAMVSGVPFVGSDCSGMNEVMKNTPATQLQFQSENVKQLIDSIKYAQSHIQNISDDFVLFRPHAKKLFSSSKVRLELSKTYEQMLGK